MPSYDPTIQDKLDDLQALTGADRKPAEIVAVFWPEPTGLRLYASAAYDELPFWPDLAEAILTEFGEAIPVTLTLIPDGTPFIDLPRAASISDDSINLTFSDLDSEFSDLLMDYGEGIRVTVYGYWPAVDLLLSMWRGMLHQPKEMNRDQVKITATSGWRAPNMLVPKRPFATSCPFIFGAFYATQEDITAAKGCPYNAHLTELERGGAPLIGVPGFTDCPRRVKADCFERLTEPDSATQTEVFWPGFETRSDPIPNNQTKGPNLLAKAIGNESALSDPIRVIAGERHVKGLYLGAFRNELNNNHPEDGFGAALFFVSEGPNLAMWEFRMMDQIVGTEHFQIRLGELGQQPTDWSPEVNSYSGTAHCYGRIQGEFDEATASDYSGSIRVLGATDVRAYSDPDTYTEGYTVNRAWWLLHVLAHLRWGYGQDYPRFDLQSFIDAAEWCDELVTLTDSFGNTFSGVRSTFNAEVTPRSIQQQVKDICTAGRLGIPFEFEGKDVVVPLRSEDVDDPDIPSFTDEGSSRNIIYDGVKSSLSWSVISDETMTNQWTVNFDDASNGGVDTQYIFGDQAQQLRAGRAWGDRSKRVVNKSQAGYGINSAQEAARFGNSLLYLGPLDSGGILNPFSVKFTTWYSEAFNVQNYRLIKVVNAKLQSRMAAYFAARGLEPYPGADFTCFRVMKYTRKGDLRVEIEAQQYATLEESPFNPECAESFFVNAVRNYDGDSSVYEWGTIAPPATVNADDYLLATVIVGDTTEILPTVPDGWEVLEQETITDGGEVYVISLLGKIYSSSDVTPYDFNPVGFSISMSVVISAWRELNPTTPVADTSIVTVATGGGEGDTPITEIVVPAVTSDHDDSTIAAIGEWRFGDIDVPLGFDSQMEHANTTISSKSQAAAGSTGAVNIPLTGPTGDDFGAGFLAALNPLCGVEPFRWISRSAGGGLKPAGIKTGDLLIANLYSYAIPQSGATPAALTAVGWEELDQRTYTRDLSPASVVRIGLFYKFVEVGDPSTYTFGGGANIDFIAINAWRGVDSSNPIDDWDVVVYDDNGPTSTVVLPALTSLGTGRKQVALVECTNQGTHTWNPPAGWELYDGTQPTSLQIGRAVADKSDIGPGSTGTATFNVSFGPAHPAHGYHLLLKGSDVVESGFSAPRDLTATVTAATGLVHFNWSPPLHHPELVTGYTLYESDGVTVVMPTALVYDFELTLAPGVYTYRLNATDGVSVSAFVSVTFTVSEPPITGADLFVIDDLTLESVLDDLTVEQVTA